MIDQLFGYLLHIGGTQILIGFGYRVFELKDNGHSVPRSCY